MSFGSKVCIGGKTGIFVGAKGNKICVKFSDGSKKWVSKSQILEKGVVTMGQLAEKMDVSKPAILYHFSQLRIKPKKIPYNSGHAQLCVTSEEAKKVIKEYGSHVTKDTTPLTLVAKKMKKHPVTLMYHCENLGIKMMKARRKDHRSILVIANKDITKIKNYYR